MAEQQKTVIEGLAEDLAKIREALQKLDKLGINEELMTLYIQNKTKLGKTIVKNVLQGQRDFLREAFSPKK